MIVNEYRAVAVWDNEKVLELDGSDAKTNMNVFRVTDLYTIKMAKTVIFMFLYFTTIFKKAIEIKTVWSWHKDRKIGQENWRKSKNGLKHVQSFDFQ